MLIRPPTVTLLCAGTGAHLWPASTAASSQTRDTSPGVVHDRCAEHGLCGWWLAVTAPGMACIQLSSAFAGCARPCTYNTKISPHARSCIYTIHPCCILPVWQAGTVSPVLRMEAVQMHLKTPAMRADDDWKVSLHTQEG